MITKEEAENYKKQVIEHIKSTFPEEKKDSAIEQIQILNDEELEQFLIQNNIIKTEGDKPQDTQCIFCALSAGSVPSTKIGENSDAIAILELNPLSEGHTIIIPKDHGDELPGNADALANDMKRKLKASLNPNDILIEHGNLFGHAIINVIPVYGDELSTEKRQATPEELAETKAKIESGKEEVKVEPAKVEEPEAEINEENTWLPKRIP